VDHGKVSLEVEAAESYRLAILGGTTKIKRKKLASPKIYPLKCTDLRNRRDIEIQYGLPPADLPEGSETGDIYLGGCCIKSNQPSLSAKMRS